MSDIKEDIYSYTTGQEAGFNHEIEIINGWPWNFKNHIRRSVLYKNSQFELDNSDRDKRPFKNIVRPILNIHYRTEGFDVKDIEIYVNNPELYYKSFLVKKFHEKWALEHELDTFIDEVVESYVDFGGTLVKNVDGVRPEVVNLQSIAFCDQTDLLSGPFAIKHYYSPAELKRMKNKGWGAESNGATIGVDDLIEKAEHQKHKQSDEKTAQTPGKYIEIYEVHGEFPDWWLSGQNMEYTPQLHIIGFYKDDNGNAHGVTLFKKKEPKLPFKFLKRDGIYGRALGFGAVEELFEAQTWTNFNEVTMLEMLEQGSKIIYVSDDPNYKNKNKLHDLESGEVTSIQQGSRLEQINNTPRNITIFENQALKWLEHANTIGAASEALQGQEPPSGTPFKLFEAQLIENKGLHRYRQGKIAVFMDEIYRDWILPYIKREVSNGQKFLAELSVDELQQISQAFITNQRNQFIKDRILNGELISIDEPELVEQKAGESFAKAGNRRFIEILKNEFEDSPLDVMTNIAGKQKNLALLTDKLVNLVRQFIATPELRSDPSMGKLLNTILESSGLSPIFFGGLQPALVQGQGGTEPLREFGQVTREAQPV